MPFKKKKARTSDYWKISKIYIGRENSVVHPNEPVSHFNRDQPMAYLISYTTPI
jgi:hypothetical protein